MNRIGWVLVAILIVLGCSGDDTAAATPDVTTAMSSPVVPPCSRSAVGESDGHFRPSFVPSGDAGANCTDSPIVVEPFGGGPTRVSSVASNGVVSAITTEFRQSRFGTGVMPPARPDLDRSLIQVYRI